MPAKKKKACAPDAGAKPPSKKSSITKHKPPKKSTAKKKPAKESDGKQPSAAKKSSAEPTATAPSWNAKACVHCRSKQSEWHFKRHFMESAAAPTEPVPPKKLVCCKFAQGTRFAAKFQARRGLFAFDLVDLDERAQRDGGELKRLLHMAPQKRAALVDAERRAGWRAHMPVAPEPVSVGVFNSAEEANRAAVEHWRGEVRGADRCACPEGGLCPSKGCNKCPDPGYVESDWGPVSQGVEPKSYTEQYLDGLVTVEEDAEQFKSNTGEAIAWVEVLGCGCGPAQRFKRDWSELHRRDDADGSDDDY